MDKCKTIRNTVYVSLFALLLGLVSCGGGGGQPNAPTPVPLADTALSASSPDGKRTAMRQLSQSTHPEALAQIRRVLIESKDPEVKSEAIAAIMNRNDFDSMPELLKILHWTSDEHPSVLINANLATNKLTGIERSYPEAGSRDERRKAYLLIADGHKIK